MSETFEKWRDDMLIKEALNDLKDKWFNYLMSIPQGYELIEADCTLENTCLRGEANNDLSNPVVLFHWVARWRSFAFELQSSRETFARAISGACCKYGWAVPSENQQVSQAIVYDSGWRKPV